MVHGIIDVVERESVLHLIRFVDLVSPLIVQSLLITSF